MIISVKPCVNCGASEISDFKEYDGCLGYEAIICKRCGYIYDQSGAHAPDGDKGNIKAKHDPRIIIEVRGGTVQAVYSDTANVSVAVLDYDEIETEDATPEFIKLEAETKGMLKII